MPSVSLLHFTDLHIGMKELPADWPTIELRLFEDLERVREMSGAWDLLLFTGDLAFQGGQEEFARVQEFLERLWARFRELDCDPKLVAVPGNHDLTWPSAEEAASVRDGWRDVGFRRDFWGDDNAGNRELVRAAFAAYEAWWGGLCSNQTSKDTARIPVLPLRTTGLLPGDFSTTFEKDGVELGLLGLNTAFLQLRDGLRRGSLGVDKYQFLAACDRPLPGWVKNHDACLLVTHHPPAWLSARTRRDLHENVVDVVRPALHLYGHMHRPEQLQSSRNGGPAQRRLQGASLFGVERWGTSWEKRIHGYSACRLEINGGETVLHIWPRRMVRLPFGAFRLRPDQDYDLDSGSEEIEPLVIQRHSGARGVSPSRSRAAVGLGAMGLGAWRPGETDERSSRRFLKLTQRLDEWLAEPPRKSGSARIRVLWLVGEDVPHRSDALRACLAHASTRSHVVVDAARDPALAGRGAEWCLRNSPGSPPLIGVELDADQSRDVWIQSRNLLFAAANAVSPPEREYARLIVAGDEEQAAAAARVLESLVEILTIDAKGRPLARPISFTGIVRSSDHVFNRGLPMTSKKLFGRGRDLQKLRDAWISRTARVVPVVAFGGTGKSALVNEWLREMDSAGYDEAAKVLAWSFYSQGTRENLVSADEFVAFARRWLGDDEEVTLSAWARGDKLASLIKQHSRFLLVLDGMEPLQHPLDSPEDLAGSLTDDSLRALLEGLAGDDWDGLCVVTTRLELTDLAAFETTTLGESATVTQLPLGNLDTRYGAELLQHLIERESDPEELRQAANDVGGHALALTLLGNYIRDVHGGDLSGRYDLEELTEDRREGEHARRVMTTYAGWLTGQGRTAELAILNLIGLFDRPAEPTAMSALLGEDDLGLLTLGLDHVGGIAWNHAVAALQSMGLLNEDAPESPGVLDAHPLVREHFRDELRNRPEMWLAGNRVLFDYYCDLPADRQPSDSKWMGALYAAVTHGCLAGLHQRVFDEVLFDRVWRGRRANYSTRVLGLTGGDLVALSNYFELPNWTELRAVMLTRSAKTLIRTNAGVRLRQLGRLMDARECFAATLNAIETATAGPDELLDASYAAAQSCELLVIAGKLAGAAGDASTAFGAGGLAVDYSERVADPYFGMHARSSLAEVHFMLGETERAGEVFEAAREIERAQDRSPWPPFLYSQGLYRFGYYLIETGRAAEILDDPDVLIDRMDREWASHHEQPSLLSKAILLLIQGAARRALIEADGGRAELLEPTAKILNDATVEFRAAGYPDYIVRGLLERASFYSVRQDGDDYRLALADLDSATFQVRRGQMELLSVDLLLGRASCQLAFWHIMTHQQRAAVREQAADDLTQAARMVRTIRYGRREGMLAGLLVKASEYGVCA